MRALVVGDILLDTIATVDHNATDLMCRVDTRECEICFGYGSKIPVLEQHVYPGGNAANVAAGLAKLGVNSVLAASVGDDDAGHKLVGVLAQSGVVVEQVITNPTIPTSSSYIVSYLGERTIFSFHAPHDITIRPVEVDIVYLTSAQAELSTLLQQIAQAAPTAKIIFQPGTRQLQQGIAQLAPVLQKTDLLILNDSEAATLLNTRRHQLSPKQLLHALLDTKATNVVVTAGQRGAYMSDGREFVHCGVWSSAIRIDTTGVGDAFASGFIWARYANHAGLAAAASAGTINAGSALSQPGAQAGLLDATTLTEKQQSITIKTTTI